MTDERKLGDIATKLLFENERVKVWELLLAPGAESDVHEHHHDHLLVQISGDRIAVAPESDTKGVYTKYLEADTEPGRTIYVERGGIETARNVGNQSYHEIIIELKD